MKQPKLRLNRQARPVLLQNAQPDRHLFIEKTFARPVRLHPFAIDDELRDGPFADVRHYLGGGPGRLFNVDFCERDTVFLEKSLGFAAVSAPYSGVKDQIHRNIIHNGYKNWPYRFAIQETRFIRRKMNAYARPWKAWPGVAPASPWLLVELKDQVDGRFHFDWLSI
jgi:hypothetical protein